MRNTLADWRVIRDALQAEQDRVLIRTQLETTTAAQFLERQRLLVKVTTHITKLESET